jgi:hypothetical protein
LTDISLLSPEDLEDVLACGLLPYLCLLHSLTLLQINLAYSELYLISAGVFRKYDLYDGTGKQTCPTLELFETGREDVDMDADFVTPFARKESLGVRLRVR